MKSSEIAILQFTRSPAAPRIKTRLSSCLTHKERIELHCRMTSHVCAAALDSGLGPVQLWVDGPVDHPFLDELCGNFPLQVFSQSGGDLGERMFAAAEQALRDFAAVVLIGSDCPFLDAQYLRRAASLLANHDGVLGPATDGGYVLLGLRRVSRLIFSGVPWGSDRVLAVTEDLMGSSGWSYRLLQPLPDIDRPDDLQLLDRSGLPDSLRQFAKGTSALKSE